MRLWEEQLAVISSVCHSTRSCLPWATPQSTISGKAKSQQEKTTFENIISLANQISKWLLLALGNPTVNYFRQKLQWQNFSQEKTKI
jgi:hypothetical protein